MHDRVGTKKFHLSQGQCEEAVGRGEEGDPIHDRVGTKKVPSVTGSVGGGGGNGGGREIPYMTELGPKKFHLSQGQWEEGRREGGREGDPMHGRVGLSVFPLPAAFVLPSAFVSVYMLTVLIFPPACELIRPSKRN